MDFALIDDILPDAHSFEPSRLRAILASTPATRIGPLVEYVYLRARMPENLPDLGALPPSGPVHALIRTFRLRRFANMPNSSAIDAESVEFFWIPPNREAVTAPAWTAFRKRFQNGAEESGFTKLVAQGLTGALDEMASNVLQH